MTLCTALGSFPDSAQGTPESALAVHAHPPGHTRLTKKSSPINQIAPGLSFISSEQWDRIRESLNLSPREFQVVLTVCAELKDRAIAERLGISIHTVRTHFERLFRKLNVNSRAGLVMCVLRSVCDHQ
jgi:DNA-binding CsgD family transcriptional regulator